MILRAMIQEIRTQKLRRGASRVYIITNDLNIIHAVFLGLTRTEEVENAVQCHNSEDIPEDCEEGELEYLPLRRLKPAGLARTIPVAYIFDVVYRGVYREPTPP